MKAQHAEEAPALLTIDAAARHLAIARRTLYRLLDAGVLPSVRLTPRAVRIPREALEEYIQARTVNGRK